MLIEFAVGGEKAKEKKGVARDNRRRRGTLEIKASLSKGRVFERDG